MPSVDFGEEVPVALKESCSCNTISAALEPFLTHITHEPFTAIADTPLRQAWPRRLHGSLKGGSRIIPDQPMETVRDYYRRMFGLYG